MTGLQKICKLYGSMKVVGADGKEVLWVWDYAKDKPVKKSEMTHEEWCASEKAKYTNGIGLCVRQGLEAQKIN